jgi:hypothetical protein
MAKQGKLWRKIRRCGLYLIPLPQFNFYTYGRVQDEIHFNGNQEYFIVHNFIHIPMGVYADTSYDHADGTIMFCVFIDRVLVFRSEFIPKNIDWYKEMYVDKDYLNKLHSFGDTIKHY